MFNFTKSQTSKRIITLTALVMAATITASALSTQANAGKRERWIAGGIAAGIVGAAIVANQPRRYNRPRPRASRWERHVRRCYRAYASYDERSDTYIGYDGYERRCRK